MELPWLDIQAAPVQVMPCLLPALPRSKPVRATRKIANDAMGLLGTASWIMMIGLITAVVADEVRNLALRAADGEKTPRISLKLPSRRSRGEMRSPRPLRRSSRKRSRLHGRSQSGRRVFGGLRRAIAGDRGNQQGRNGNGQDSATGGCQCRGVRRPPSEEMNAQAEETRSFAGELANMAGGNSSNGNARSAKVMPTTQYRCKIELSLLHDFGFFDVRK